MSLKSLLVIVVSSGFPVVSKSPAFDILSVACNALTSYIATKIVLIFERVSLSLVFADTLSAYPVVLKFKYPVNLD